MTALKPLMFELNYRREAYRRVGNTLVRDEAKDADLPKRPPQFSPVRGTHEYVAKHADELNNVQRRSGFLHYFFFPEVADARSNPDHCDMCRRLARRYDGRDLGGHCPPTHQPN